MPQELGLRLCHQLEIDQERLHSLQDHGKHWYQTGGDPRDLPPSLSWIGTLWWLWRPTKSVPISGKNSWVHKNSFTFCKNSQALSTSMKIQWLPSCFTTLCVFLPWLGLQCISPTKKETWHKTWCVLFPDSFESYILKAAHGHVMYKHTSISAPKVHILRRKYASQCPISVVALYVAVRVQTKKRE